MKGFGRLAEIETIVEEIEYLLTDKGMSGQRVLVTAGPTREAIDPVRYLSNLSSGKMGFALAQAASEAGAKVILVAGPVQQQTPAHVERVDVLFHIEKK